MSILVTLILWNHYSLDKKSDRQSKIVKLHVVYPEHNRQNYIYLDSYEFVWFTYVNYALILYYIFPTMSTMERKKGDGSEGRERELEIDGNRNQNKQTNWREGEGISIIIGKTTEPMDPS